MLSEVQDLISTPRQSRNIASKPQPRAASEFLRQSHLKDCSKNTAAKTLPMNFKSTNETVVGLVRVQKPFRILTNPATGESFVKAS